MSRLERQLRAINPRTLYNKKRKNSADAMLLSSLAATEAILINNNNNNIVNSAKSKSSTPEPLDPNVPNHNVAHNIKLRPKIQKLDVPHQNANSFKSNLNLPPQPHVHQPHNSLHPAAKLEAELSNSVIVNLSLTGGNPEDKRRLSKLLREVNEMREIRDRHDSYASEVSLEANILKTEEIELKRITKIQRSKQLLFKYKIYDFLKRPASFGAMVYHVFAFLLVFACLILSIYPAIETEIGKFAILDILEKFVLFLFTTEFVIMLWCSDCRPQYQGFRGKIAFIKSPAHFIDLIVIILSAVLPSLSSSHDGHEVFAFRAFRGFHRFFQLLQVIALKRQLRPWRLFWSVLYDQREQLLIIFYLEIVLLCLLSYLAFLVEHEANQNLENIADAMWWSIVTLTTVGYGDKVPVTWMGKLISAFFILFGVAVFALPAGIIGAGLALKLEEVERSRQRRLKKEAAAKLIQRSWKCYQANHAYFELSSFFRHQPGDLYKGRVYDNITKAFIATVRFHQAKSNFKELTRPVDLRNVIESYKYGQMDIFSRLKQLNSALDIIISRMSTAENDRIMAINHLARRLEELEGIGSSGETFDGPNAQHSTNLGLRLLDLVNIPPMPQTNTHPSSIPLRSRPHSTNSHHNPHHNVHSHSGAHHYSSHHHYQRPMSTPNYYYPPYRNSQSAGNSQHQSNHTITTIDEVTLNDQGEEINAKYSSDISFVIEDYSNNNNNKSNNQSTNCQLKSSLNKGHKLMKRIIHRRNSQ